MKKLFSLLGIMVLAICFVSGCYTEISESESEPVNVKYHMHLSDVSDHTMLAEQFTPMFLSVDTQLLSPTLQLNVHIPICM